MVYWYALMALAILGFIYMRFEAGLVEVKRVEFTKNKSAFKILQISDIHVNHLKVPSEKVRKIMDSERPDLVIITGDYIEKQKNIPAFLKFLSEIKGDHKIFLCLGNHDYRAFKKDKPALEKYIKAIESTGAVILHNKSVCYEKNSKKYNIIGIADMRYGHHDIDMALKACCEDAFANIGFSHNPDIVLELPRGKVDYLLAGHFHGGQIWAPFNIEFALLRKEKLCKMGIRRGLHKVNGVNLYINKGLGCVCFPLRFMSRPEITVFYIP